MFLKNVTIWGKGSLDIRVDPMQEFIEKHRRFFKPLLLVAVFALVFLIGWLRLLTGPEYAFSFLYLLPIVLVTWLVSAYWGMLVSVVSAFSWLLADLSMLDRFSNSFIPLVNESFRLMVFLFMVLLITRYKKILKTQKELAQAIGVKPARIKERVTQLSETNPMLGHRGCRLAVTHPEILEMQVRAIVEAAIACQKKRINAKPEIMIPLVGAHAELRVLRQRVEATMAAVKREQDYTKTLDIPVGTMIEVPRAALIAEKIGRHADFFSFGTNDLTQMTFGYSRDDAGAFLPAYIAQELIPKDPFQSLDTAGVGQLVEMAVAGGRRSKPGMRCGICGEHGGDPVAIDFCHTTGLDYVSCSPFRVPVARLAAAQAAIRHEAE